MIDTKKITPFITIGILDMAIFSRSLPDLAKRELEKAATRVLLTQLLGTPVFTLAYHATKKPFLMDRSEHISISHSHDKLAIIINEKENTGIDIELLRDKVIKIRHKFLSGMEMDFAKENIEKLITIWAAKEAMYKIYGLKQLDFRKNLFVEDFEGSVIFGKIDNGDFKKQYRLISEDIDNYKMVYVLNEL